ncbi:MAG: hypothetical protein ACE5G1_00100 [bacterium]
MVRASNLSGDFSSGAFKYNRLLSLSLYVILLANLSLPGITFSQNPFERPNSSINRLSGGNIGMNFKWSGSLFSGLGTHADAMGGSISTLYPGADAIYSNPAGLGFASGFSINLDWSPPLSINPGGVIGIEGRINDGLLSAVEQNPPIDPQTGEFLPAKGAVEDANFRSELAMNGGLKGGVVMYGNRFFSVAGAFHQPLRFESQINLSGTEFLAAALDDNGDITHRMFGTINGNLNLNLNVEASTIGIGTELLPGLSLGLVYDNFNGEMNFSGTVLPEGIISSSGDTKSFNDPRAIQYDSLFATIRGDWEGNGQRIRSAIGFHPRHNLSLDLVFTTPLRIDMRGPFSMVHNTIRALNLNAEGDEEVLDVDILVEDNLTKTKKIVTRVPGMDLQAPGSLALGFSTNWQNYFASFTYTTYFDKLGYRFSFEEVDSLGQNIKSGEVRQGIDLGNSFRIGIGVEQLILGLGVLFAETFEKTTTIKPSQNGPKISTKGSRFFLPFFSLGGGVDVSSSFRLDYVFNFFKSSFLRFSTTYKL